MPKKKKARIDQATLAQSFSKNLLGLKFMQRAKKEIEKSREEEYSSDDDDEEEEEKNDSKSSLNISETKIKKKCILNPSYQFCERLRFGRFSFQGMNLDIEALMQINNESNSAQKDTSNHNLLAIASNKRPAATSSSSGSSCSDNEGPSGAEELNEHLQ